MAQQISEYTLILQKSQDKIQKSRCLYLHLPQWSKGSNLFRGSGFRFKPSKQGDTALKTSNLLPNTMYMYSKPTKSDYIQITKEVRI